MVSNIDQTIKEGVTSPNDIMGGKLNVSCYPLPATNELNVNFGSATAGVNYIGIYDMLGKTVLYQSDNSSAGENNFTIDVSHIARGIYFVEVVNGNENSVQKILLE